MEQLVRECSKLQQWHRVGLTLAELVRCRGRRDGKSLSILDIEHDSEQRFACVRNQRCSEQCIDLCICIRRNRHAAPCCGKSVQVCAIKRAARSFVRQVQIVRRNRGLDSTTVHDRPQRHGLILRRHIEGNNRNLLQSIDFDRDVEPLTRTCRLCAA